MSVKKSKRKKKSTMKSLFTPPASHILKQAKNFPFYECLINSDWKEQGIANVIVARKQSEEKIISGVFLVDIFCLGLKNTFYVANQTTAEYEKNLKEKIAQRFNLQECSTQLAHSVIYKAIDYARELGFSPHHDFEQTKYVLELSKNIKLSRIKCGYKGKPHFIPGPDDDVDYILQTLDNNVGPGNYYFIIEA